jgi:putative ABC transport system substrate-binding protein
MRIIGILDTTYDDAYLKLNFGAFEQAFPKLGWVDGQTVRIQRRIPGSSKDRIDSDADVLVSLAPDVLIANSTVLAAALAKRTRQIPIVFMFVGNPIDSGFTDGLARPSRNMTGFTVFDPTIGGKMVQFLRDLAPNLRTVMAMYNPDFGGGRSALSMFMARTKQSGIEMGIEVRDAHVRTTAEIESTMAQTGEHVGLMVGADQFVFSNRRLIIDLAARYRVPAIYSWASYVREGGLMAYTIDSLAQWQGAADYADRILRGTNVVDLPIQQPSKFNFVINLKTAAALGFTVPREVLVLAQEVIE